MPIYRVQAPNGKIYKVEGPDDADPNTLFSFVQQQLEGEETRRLQKEYGPGIFKTFTQGVGRGAGELGSLVTDIIPAMAGSALGFEDYAKEQLAEAAQKRQARELEAPPVFRSYKDVEGFGDALKFGAEVIGEQIPNIATSLIPGVGGGVLAGRAALTTAGKALATQAAERGLVGEAATAFVAEGMKRAAPQVAARAGMGTNVGTFLGSYAQNAPEVFQNVFEETGQLEPGVAMLFGAGSAALDSVLPATLARQLTGPMKVGIVEKVLEKSGMDKGLLRSVTAGMLKGANVLKGVPVEGLTEGAQEAISIAAEKFVANNPQIFESKEWDRIMESSVRGAIAGGAFSAAGSGVERMRERVREQYKEQIDAAAQEAAQTGEPVPLQIGYDPNVSAPTTYGGQTIYVYPDGSTQFVSEMTDEAMAEKYPEPEAPVPPEQRAKEEKAAAVRARQAEQRKTAQLKEDAAKLKKAIADLTAVPTDLVSLAKGPTPLEQTIRQAQGELDVLGAKRAPKTPSAPVAAPTTAPTTAPVGAPASIPGMEGTIISDTKAFGKQLGVGPTAKMLKAVAGKDLSNPADVAEVRQILEAYASGKPAVGAAEKIEAFLNRPEFQIAEAEVPSEPTTRPDVGAVGAGVPSVSEGAGDVGGGGAPAVGESIGLGLGETGDVTGQPAAGEERVSPALTEEAALKPEPETISPRTEERIQESAVRQANFIAELDADVDKLLNQRFQQQAEQQGVPLDAIPSEDYRGSEAHNILRLPRLFAQHRDSMDMLQTSTDEAQRSLNERQIAQIEKAIADAGPDAVQLFQRLQATPVDKQNAVLSQLNQMAIRTFDAQAKDKVAQAKASTEVPGAAPSKKSKKALTDEELDALTHEFNKRHQKRGGGKLFLPAYRGASLDATGKDLAISGDLRGLIDHLQARATNPIVRGMLAKIKRLNLKTKIVVRNPEGPMALRTPEFQRWFGGSKVVDENGNPLVVYHGTSKDVDFNKFKLPKNGAWFTTDPESASQYAVENDSMGFKYNRDTRNFDEINTAARVMPVFVRIENPYTLTAEERATLLKAANYNKAQGVIFERAKAQGYDGIRMGDGIWVAIKDPTQIKSAIGNVGTYDPTSPDIRYAANKAGSFDPRTNTIALDPDNGLNEHTVLHELMHAAISHVLRNPSLPVTKQLTELFDGIRGQMGTAYGAQDIQEFTSELFSNPEFQALLKGIKAPKSGSLFKRIVQALANFFGFTKGTSAYDRGMKLVNDALDISAEVEPSVSDMMFLGTPNLMREAFNVVGDIGRAMPSLAGRTVESTKNSLSNAPSDLKSMALSLLRLDNLNTIYGKELPSIQTLTDNIELRNGMQEKAVAEINKNYKFFEETQKKFPAQFKVMEDMAYDARLEMADPKDPDFLKQTGLSAKQQQEYRRLRNIYNSLPADVRKTYDMIRDAYTKAIDDYEAMLVGDPDKGIPGLVDSSVAAKLKLQFQAKKRQIAYIPFLRRGDFWVEYDIDGERAASAFQSIRERDRFIRQELAPKGIQYRMYQNIENQSFQQGTLPPTSFIVGVMADLNKQGASQEIKDNVYQAYLALFPAASISKNFMKADNVRGMERDIARGYAETMVKWSRKLANTKYAGPINQAFDAIDGEAEAVNDPSVYAAAQNIRNRQNFINNPTYNKLTSAATSLSYFTFIAGNVSSALVNLSTLPLFAWPMLGGRFGFDKATFALTGATKIASMYALKKKVPGKYARLFDVLNDHAQLEHTMAREVLEGRRQTTADYLGFKARVMDLISKPFHISEVMNRGATAIAAYELALKGNPALKIPAMNEADAIRYALSAVKDMNTSGLSASASTYMQHPLGRVMLTFKSFAWNQAALIARAFHQSVKGESPEVRKEAFRQLVGTYGMAMALAGANGMPFMGAASVLANMINALLGDDDEPFDFDVLMRQWTNELFYKGLPNYFLNLEVSNRIGVANDLLFRDDPRGVAEDGYVMTALRQLAGPLGSYAVGVENGAKLMREGNVQRGIEAVLPSFLRNALKGARYMSEGALTLKGDPIVDDVSVYNGVMQMLGFTPADLSLAYEDVSMRKGYEREILAQRKRLLDRYEIARTTDDYDLMEEVREGIARFNDRRIDPKARISSDTLRRSMKAREAAEKNMINGVRFNKRLMPEITDLLEEE